MRRFLLLTAVLATSAAAACGGSESGSSESSGSDSRVAATPHGKVTVPADAKRIVSLHPYTLNAMLDVGVVPAGTMKLEGADVLPQHARAAAAIPVVGSNVDVNFEKVAELRPDVIVGSQVPGVDYGYAKLDAIAPTVLWKMTVPGDWKRVSTQTAALLGRADRGAALKRRYDARIAKLRETHASALRRLKWAIARGAGANFQVDGPTSWAGIVLRDLGVRFAAASRIKPPVEEHSFEEIGVLGDADVIFVEGSLDSDRPQAESRELMRQPLWDRLPAAKAGRVVPLKVFYPLSYGQAMVVLDQVEAVLQGA